MFIEYLQYPFFLRALIVGGIIGFLLSTMSTYVVLRKEVLFTHALSNIGFLGIALAILFNFPVTFSLIISCLVGAYLISLIQRKKLFANDSLLGIFSQLGLALAIIVIALFPGYRINIEQFLFGDILGINQMDVWVSGILFVVIGGLLTVFHKKFLMISLSDELSHTLVKRKNFFNALFIIVLAVLIAMAMKIIGVLLVAAFITIPANTSKILMKSMRGVFVLSSILGLIGVVLGLFASAAFDLPSGAMIVLALGIFWILAILGRKIFNR